jgi:CDP-glycerol glycerophosphotransferase (TagB/SpsB family)
MNIKMLLRAAAATPSPTLARMVKAFVNRTPMPGSTRQRLRLALYANNKRARLDPSKRPGLWPQARLSILRQAVHQRLRWAVSGSSKRERLAPSRRSGLWPQARLSILRQAVHQQLRWAVSGSSKRERLDPSRRSGLWPHARLSIRQALDQQLSLFLYAGNFRDRLTRLKRPGLWPQARMSLIRAVDQIERIVPGSPLRPILRRTAAQVPELIDAIVDAAANPKALRGRTAVRELLKTGQFQEAADLACELLQRLESEEAVEGARIVKLFLRDHPTEAFSAPVFAQHLWRFGVLPPFHRRLLDKVLRNGQAVAVFDQITKLIDAADGRIPEQALGVLVELADAAGADVISYLRRLYEASEDEAVKAVCGRHLGARLGVSIKDMMEGRIENAFRSVPRQFHGKVVVLVEQGAQVELLAKDERFRDCHLVVYALQDVGNALAGTGATIGSYRDKVPDHSEAMARVYEFAQPVASAAADAAIEALGELGQARLAPYREVVSLAYEDEVAGALTQLECYDACMRENPDAEAIVFVCYSGKRLGYGVPYLYRDGIPTRAYLFVLRDRPTRLAVLSDIGAVLHDSPTSVQQAKDDDTPENNTCTISLPSWIEGIACNFGPLIKLYRIMLPQSYILFGGHLNQQNYGETIISVLNISTGIDGNTLLYDVSESGSSAARDRRKDLSAHNVAILTLGWLEREAINHDTIAAFSRAEVAVSKVVQGRIMYHGNDLSKFVGRVLGAFTAKGLPILFARALFFDALLDTAPPLLFFVSTTRMVNLRCVAVKARTNNIPVVDIQALNVLRHPKYKAPVADRATVIDHLSAEIYTDYLGYPADRICITGSPRIDQIRAGTLATNVPEALHSLGIADNRQPRILFASQLQPIERCESILRQLCTVSRETGSPVIVKLHPREGDSRMQAYRRLIEREGAADGIHIVGRVPIQKVLAISHVVVTMFSNVAREALLVGKHVIVANYFDSELPLRFDKEGVAVGAYSEQELRERVREGLALFRLSGGQIAGETPYMARNPHLKLGNSSEAIIALGQTLIQPRPRRRKPAFPKFTNRQLSATPIGPLIEVILDTFRLGAADESVSLLKRLGRIGHADKVARAALPSLLSMRETDDHLLSLLADLTVKTIGKLEPVSAIVESAREVAGALPSANVLDAVHGRAEGGSCWRTLMFLGEVWHLGGSYRRASEAFLAAAERRSETATKVALQADGTALWPHALNADPPSSLRLDGSGLGITLIVQRGCDPGAVSAWVTTGLVRRVVAEDPAAVAELDKDSLEIMTYREVLGDQSPMFGDLIRDCAEGFASDFYQALHTVTRETEIGAFVQRQRTAIEAWVRASLIDDVRSWYVNRRIAQEAEGGTLIALAIRPSFLSSFREIGTTSERIYVQYAGKDRAGRRRWGQLIVRGNQESSDEVALGSSQTAGGDGALSAFRKRLQSEFSSRRCSPPLMSPLDQNTERVLFIGRWALKTVPGTLAPLIECMPETTAATIIACGITEAEQANVLNRLRSARPDAEIQLISASEFGRALVSRPLCDELFEQTWKRSAKSKALNAWGIPLSQSAHRRAGLFCRTILFQLLDLEAEIGQLLALPGRSIVAVSPGRHAEAIVAQNAARRMGKLSVDIQNAYMSSGYTYTKPHGDLVTAIDQWSVDLFRDHFKIPPDAIHKVGTPRFDAIPRALANLAGTSEEPAPDLGFSDPARPLVCFATQPGRSAGCLRIARLVAETRPSTGPYNAIVKLHPQDTESIESYQSVLDRIETDNEVKVLRDAPMHPLIRASNVVITIFSNVGIEAAIFGKDLLVANLENEELPLPLDKFGIGANAYSDEEFREALARLLSEPEFRALHRQRRRRFFESNPQLLRGDSCQRICELLRQHMR